MRANVSRSSPFYWSAIFHLAIKNLEWDIFPSTARVMASYSDGNATTETELGTVLDVSRKTSLFLSSAKLGLLVKIWLWTIAVQQGAWDIALTKMTSFNHK